MFLKFLTLAALCTGGFVDGADDIDKDSQQISTIIPNCKQLNDLFNKANNKFQECILTHNENATFCEECIDSYADTLVAFDNLMTQNETDHHKEVKPCRSRFVDANQLDLVETIMGYSKRLWEIGDCSGEFNCNDIY